MSWVRLSNSATTLIAIIAILGVVFGSLLTGLEYYQHVQDIDETHDQVKREAEAIGGYIVEAILRNNYQNIDAFVQAWGQHHADVAVLSIIANNGFEIARYQRDLPAQTAATVNHPIGHEGRRLGSVVLTSDIQEVLEKRHQAHLNTLPYIAIFVAVLALMMWAALTRMVLLPMERTDERLAMTAKELAARNQDLRRALVRAEEASRSKSQFLAAMSHELRTPLNAVIGFSDMMRHQTFGKLGSERYEHYAGAIHDSGQHLLELINDVLDVSKIESGTMELHFENVPLYKPLHAAIRMVRDQARVKGVELSTELPDRVPVLWADERRTKQIVLNLLSNAVKFTEPGGRVSISASVENGSGDTVIRVTDTGIGMTSEELEVALTLFGQADSDLNRKFSGTGLGLPLTKELTELHGGQLTVESEVNAGTTVTVRLPADIKRGEIDVPATQNPEHRKGAATA